MSWNYRVVKHQPEPTGNPATEGYSSAYYAVHEVYYHRGTGQIRCYADAEETAETLEELIGQLELKLIAAKAAASERQHIINEDELPKGEEGEEGKTNRAQSHSFQLQCAFHAWRVIGKNELALDLPPGNCCDMTGAIDIAKKIMPDAMRIMTLSGAVPDTEYLFYRGRWMAICHGSGRLVVEGRQG